ncbi:YigZ family protein [Acholeplasma sp. OttesenSCG-928-E16]|nr:YigZ family protein [Acholeplasma sp. OttesenSCG-928-E16]
MKYLKHKVTNEIIISKSRFIGILIPVSSNSMIPDLISSLKKEYPKATHYCYASITGENGEYHNSSDDGEPSGTAGVPILSVLKHHEVTDILCVVIRYYGGIKLGAGGLIRAYGSCCSKVLEYAIFYKKKTVPLYKLSFNYSLIDKIEHLLKDKANIIDKEFLNNVTYSVYLDDITVLEDINHLLDHKEFLGNITLDINI